MLRRALLLAALGAAPVAGRSSAPGRDGSRAPLARLGAALEMEPSARPDALAALLPELPPALRTTARYAQAAALIDRGGPGDAERASALLEGGDPRFAALAALLRGRLHAAAGRPADALAGATPYLEIGERVFPLRRAALGWAIDAGDMPVATRLLAALESRLPAAERAALISRLGERIPELPAAQLPPLADWVLARHPGGALEEKLLAAYAAAGLPDPLAALDAGAHRRRCERMAGLRKFSAALDECAALPEAADRLAAARWLRQDGRVDAAATALAELARDPAAEPFAAEVVLERAELSRARGDHSGAQRLFEEVAAAPAGAPAARAQLYLYAQADDGETQQRWLRAYVENPQRGPDWGQRALSLAVSEFAASRIDAAEEWANRLAGGGKPGDDLVNGAWYLLGRVREARGDAEGARAWYARLMRADKYGYYGMLARRRSDTPAPQSPARGALFHPAPGSATESGDLLLMCGFPEWAADHYRAAGPAARSKEGLAWYLAGEYSRAANSARGGSEAYGEAGDKLDRAAWMLSYPPAYAGLVGAGAADEDPLLTLALMRQESFFNREAVSSAGAKGLMQLMPATAARVARQLGLPYDPARLDEPAYNTALGRRYFYDLLASFGEPAFALAGYNAGPGRVPQWRGALGDDDLDLFIERIPLKETRSYVRRILLNWQEYRRIYGDGAGAAQAERALREAPWAGGWPGQTANFASAGAR